MNNKHSLNFLVECAKTFKNGESRFDAPKCDVDLLPFTFKYYFFWVKFRFYFFSSIFSQLFKEFPFLFDDFWNLLCGFFVFESTRKSVHAFLLPKFAFGRYKPTEKAIKSRHFHATKKYSKKTWQIFFLLSNSIIFFVFCL